MKHGILPTKKIKEDNYFEPQLLLNYLASSDIWTRKCGGYAFE
jgi:hypothetical protein